MAKMTKMMMGRNYTLRTSKGHTIRFKKMEPKWVPKSVESEAMRFGAFPADTDEKAVQQADEEEASKPKMPDEPREIRLRNAIIEMVGENVRNDWTGTGRPKNDVLAKRAQVDDLHGQERDEIFDALKAEGQI